MTVTDLFSDPSQRIVAERSVTVTGIASGANTSAAGHLFFTLTDGHSKVERIARRGLVKGGMVVPAKGSRVMATGTVSIYRGNGKVQLIVSRLAVATAPLEN